MLKKLDLLIIKSYIGPFIITFFVTLFVLVMQFFWLYMDELIGKGLGTWMILELLVLMSATLVPMALPLGVLTASIMSFGNMGENFELVAIKASGISLNRFMRPLLVFIIFISGLAFVFNNNVIPVANLKALSLLYDLRNSKPTFNIRAGMFNDDITGYAIRIGEKDEDGHTIRDIIIYDHTAGYGDQKIIIAKEGSMLPVKGKKMLVFRLKDGWRYEEERDKSGNSRNNQTRMHFGTWDKVFDLSSFKVNHTNEDLFKDAYQMMNVKQLNVMIDSLNKTVNVKHKNSYHNYLKVYFSPLAEDREGIVLNKKIDSVSYPEMKVYKKSFLNEVKDSLKPIVLSNALTSVKGIRDYTNVITFDKKLQNTNLVNHLVEFHQKFSLSFACVLLFLIGAPLGAIIRKGGFGMPMIFAIVFFIVWYIMSIIGKKLTQSGELPAWMGMWIATAMLLPIALFMIRQARNDSSLFNKDWYLRKWSFLKGLFFKRKLKKLPIEKTH